MVTFSFSFVAFVKARFQGNREGLLRGESGGQEILSDPVFTFRSLILCQVSIRKAHRGRLFSRRECFTFAIHTNDCRGKRDTGC